MSVLAIRTYPDPVLRVRCRPVENFDSRLEKFTHDMIDTMYAAPGIGLAAPQVGIEERVAVVDLGVVDEEGQALVLVNPEIVNTDGSETDVEGCLSIPEYTDKVERPERITVRAQDAAGEQIELDAAGLLARAIQHELDHLDGILFVDHLRGLRKERAKRHLRRLATQEVTT